MTGTFASAAPSAPLPGVQIRVVGTQRGAATDASGVIASRRPDGHRELTAHSRLCAGSRAVTLGDRRRDGRLHARAGRDDARPVVVTATGQSERRRESGASTATIDATQITTAAVSTFSDVLSSRAPGVVVMSSAGESGAGTAHPHPRLELHLAVQRAAAHRRRRPAGQHAESSPIDVGGQFPSRINDINPEEIESIEVVKGPAAAALYGTAASNGVIQITTKRGRAGKTRWDVLR